MQQHRQFNLSIHWTDELEYILGKRIAVREQRHLWPLSSVELLTTADGERYIYKVQREPTVEPEFYARAKTTLLPTCRILQRDAHQAVLLLPFLESATLRGLGHDEATLVARGRELIQDIAAIGGDVPVYRNIGSAAAWRDFTDTTIRMLAALVDAGIFKQIDYEDIRFLRQFVNRERVIDAVDETSQLINGDLKAEHVFCSERGYKVIDWQRPYRAPGGIDLVLLLDSLKIPAHRHIPSAIIGLRWFLYIHWAVEAKTSLLPDLPFFGDWVRSGIDQIRSSAE